MENISEKEQQNSCVSCFFVFLLLLSPVPLGHFAEDWNVAPGIVYFDIRHHYVFIALFQDEPYLTSDKKRKGDDSLPVLLLL